MKYFFIVVVFILICFFYLNVFPDTFVKHKQFWSEFNDTVELLNNRIDRILYVKVLQEGDTLYFTSNDLKDTFWIINDTSIIADTFRIEYDLEFWDSGGMVLVDKNFWGDIGYGEIGLRDLPLMGDVFIYPDQFSGNTYVINADGDTIFKYIKKEKE